MNEITEALEHTFGLDEAGADRFAHRCRRWADEFWDRGWDELAAALEAGADKLEEYLDDGWSDDGVAIDHVDVWIRLAPTSTGHCLQASISAVPQAAA